jgi:hypothetical protein
MWENNKKDRKFPHEKLWQVLEETRFLPGAVSHGG